MTEPVKLSLDYLSFNAYRASSTENFLIPTRESIWLTKGSMCETPSAAWYVSGTGSMFHSCIVVKEGLMFYKLSSLIDRWMSLCCKTFVQNLPSAQLAFWIWAATSLSRDPLMYIVLSSYVKESMFFSTMCYQWWCMAVKGHCLEQAGGGLLSSWGWSSDKTPSVLQQICWWLFWGGFSDGSSGCSHQQKVLQ